MTLGLNQVCKLPLPWALRHLNISQVMRLDNSFAMFHYISIYFYIFCLILGAHLSSEQLDP